MITFISNVKSQRSKPCLPAGRQILDIKSNVKYRAYYFSLNLISFVQDFPEKKIYWIFQNQLLRSGTSIGANIVEAKSSSSKKEFIQFYEISLKSANETLYWLCLLRDANLINKEKTNKLLKETEELSKMIGSALLTMKNKKKI